MVVFTVHDDSFGVSSPAVSRVVFNSTDDLPHLDLNGPTVDGTNTAVLYTEGAPAIKVRELNVLYNVQRRECEGGKGERGRVKGLDNLEEKEREEEGELNVGSQFY